MKILILTTGYPRYLGDVFGNFVEDLLLEYDKSINITVLAPRDNTLPFKEIRGNITIIRPKYFPFIQQVAYGSGIPNNIQSFWVKIQLPFFMLSMAIWACVLSKKTDIIHAHWGVSGLWGYFASKFSKKPFIVTYWGSDLHGSKIIKKISLWVSTKSKMNLCVSKEQFNTLQVSHKILSAVPINTTRFTPLSEIAKISLREKYNLNPKMPTFVFVGQLIPLKRVGLILKCFEKLDEPCQIMIAGEGVEKDDLKMKFNSPNIHFLGAVSYLKVHELFQCADIHLLASEREGKPNVIYQAMASGIPSISTHIGGVPEMIESNKTGWLVKPDGSDYFEAMQVSLCLNKSKEMGTQAKAKLETLGVDSETVVKQHIDLYKKIILGHYRPR